MKDRTKGEWLIIISVIFIFAQMLFAWIAPNSVSFLDEYSTEVFAAGVTILGLIIAVLAICFALKTTESKNRLYTKGNRFWFIDCFRLALIDVFALVLCLIFSKLNGVAVLILMQIFVQIFYIFHYYFKELFGRKNSQPQRIFSKKFLASFYRTITLVIPVVCAIAAVFVLTELDNMAMLHFGIIILQIMCFFLYSEFVIEKPKKEKFDELDDCGVCTGAKIDRDTAHKNGAWHRAVVLFLVNDKNEILLQKRSMDKKTWPGRWDVTSGGHVNAGEKAEKAAVRELKEELGIKIKVREIKRIGGSKSENKNEKMWDRHFNEYFIARKNVEIEDIELQDGEVDETKWIDFDTLKNLVKTKDTTLTEKWDAWGALIKAEI
jgi:isopentenyl-diphosphate delta-isomerase type 1